MMSNYTCANTTYALLKVPRKCSSALILPFHSQGRFGSAIHHISKSLFRLGRAPNSIIAFGRMEVRKRRPYDVFFLATPRVQMWRKNSTHYSPRKTKLTALTNTSPPRYLPLLLHSPRLSDANARGSRRRTFPSAEITKLINFCVRYSDCSLSCHSRS